MSTKPCRTKTFTILALASSLLNCPLKQSTMSTLNYFCILQLGQTNLPKKIVLTAILFVHWKIHAFVICFRKPKSAPIRTHNTIHQNEAHEFLYIFPFKLFSYWQLFHAKKCTQYYFPQKILCHSTQASKVQWVSPSQIH